MRLLQMLLSIISDLDVIAEFEQTLGLLTAHQESKLRISLHGIKEIMKKNDHVNKDDIYVAFYDFADSSLNIFLSVYLKVLDRTEELKVREALFFRNNEACRKFRSIIRFPIKIYIHRKRC